MNFPLEIGNGGAYTRGGGISAGKIDQNSAVLLLSGGYSSVPRTACGPSMHADEQRTPFLIFSAKRVIFRHVFFTRQSYNSATCQSQRTAFNLQPSRELL